MMMDRQTNLLTVNSTVKEGEKNNFSKTTLQSPSMLTAQTANDIRGTHFTV